VPHHHVFVSYAREDASWARIFADLFKAQGWKVFLDSESMEPGTSIEAALRDAVQHSRTVVVLWTRQSIKSQWVWSEAMEARRRERLIPVLLDKILVEELPYGLQDLHALPLDEWDGRTTTPAIARLIDSISKRLTTDPAGPLGGDDVELLDARTKPTSPSLETRPAEATVRSTSLALVAERFGVASPSRDGLPSSGTTDRRPRKRLLALLGAAVVAVAVVLWAFVTVRSSGTQPYQSTATGPVPPEEAPPLAFDEGVRTTWAPGKTTSVRLQELLVTSKRDLTRGGRVRSTAIGLLYEGPRAEARVRVVFKDHQGRTFDSPAFRLTKGIWTRAGIDLVPTSGFEMRDVRTAFLRLETPDSDEPSSVVSVGLYDSQLAPPSMVIQKLRPQSLFHRTYVDGLIAVSSQLRDAASTGKLLAVMVFGPDSGSTPFVTRVLRRDRLAFPVEFSFDQESVGPLLGKRCRVVALLQAGTSIFAGHYQGVPVTRMEIRLDRSATSEEVQALKQLTARYMPLQAAQADWRPDILEKECAGVPQACWKLGLLYFQGVNVSQSSQRALHYWRLGCRAEDAESCNGVGMVLAGGDRKHLAEAMAAFRRACDAKYLGACGNLAQVSLVENPRDREAVKLLERACAGEIPEACGHLGLVLLDGSIVRRDLSRAVQMLKAGCNAPLPFPEACQALGVLLIAGELTLRDPAAAAIYFERACAGGIAAACCNLGNQLDRRDGIERDFARAREFFVRGCEAKSGCACNNLGMMSQEGRDGIPPDSAAARAQLREACDLGHGLGCENEAAFLSGQPGVDVERAVAAARIGCDQRQGRACYLLGDLLRRRGDATRDFRKAWLLGCELKNAEACLALKEDRSNQ
jgi:TPR repeat protein